MLCDKYALGLGNPYVPRMRPIRAVASDGADLSRRLAAESVTLLKNEKGLLPLSRDIAKIAIIGPHADDVAAGFTTYAYPAGLKMMHARPPVVISRWRGRPRRRCAARGESSGGGRAGAGVQDRSQGPPSPITRRRLLAEAVRQLLPKAEVTAVAGTGVVPSEPTDIPAAVAAARNADVVILAVGGRSAWSDERTEGEGSDTANKDLPPQQVELINAVTAVGKPTIAVISMGGPYALAS